MESIDFMDKHLDPPDTPEYAECAKCGGNNQKLDEEMK